MGLIGVGAGTPSSEEYHSDLPSRTVYMKILLFMTRMSGIKTYAMFFTFLIKKCLLKHLSVISAMK